MSRMSFARRNRALRLNARLINNSEVFVRKLLSAVALFAVVGCGPRAVDVTTGVEPASEVSVRFTNNLNQAVNFYIVSGGNNIFVKQVAANTVEWIPIQGFRAGTSVTLQARAVSGAPTYSRHNVVLEQTLEWSVP